MNLPLPNSLIKIGGIAVKVSDVRGLIVENFTRMVVLNGGKKMRISIEERDQLQAALSCAAKGLHAPNQL